MSTWSPHGSSRRRVDVAVIRDYRDYVRRHDAPRWAHLRRCLLEEGVRAIERGIWSISLAHREEHVDEALRYLGYHVVEMAEGAAVAAAAAWLGLSPDERERTSIYASGRALRSEVNEAVQTGLRANGELGNRPSHLDTLSRVNVTREELRYPISGCIGQHVQPVRN